MHVMKFGGSSVATPERILQVIDVVAAQTRHPVAIVVSAFGGVTDSLIAVGQKASQGDGTYVQDLAQIKERHFSIAHALIPSATLPPIDAHLEKEFKELTDALQGIALIKELTKRSLDLLMSFGERLSAYIIAAAMQVKVKNAVFVDARTLIVTDRHFGAAHVNYEQTYARIAGALGENQSTPIITGFIASSTNGETTTLGRGGSDFTAAIIGAALNAEVVSSPLNTDNSRAARMRSSTSSALLSW